MEIIFPPGHKNSQNENDAGRRKKSINFSDRGSAVCSRERDVVLQRLHNVAKGCKMLQKLQKVAEVCKGCRRLERLQKIVKGYRRL